MPAKVKKEDASPGDDQTSSPLNFLPCKSIGLKPSHRQPWPQWREPCGMTLAATTKGYRNLCKGGGETTIRKPGERGLRRGLEQDWRPVR